MACRRLRTLLYDARAETGSSTDCENMIVETGPARSRLQEEGLAGKVLQTDRLPTSQSMTCRKRGDERFLGNGLHHQHRFANRTACEPDIDTTAEKRLHSADREPAVYIVDDAPAAPNDADPLDGEAHARTARRS
jgi:hypothetical protein